MRILGIESSCDETAAAAVEDGQRLLSNEVVSQIDIHAEFGGVVPEVAARSHLEVITPVIQRALATADCSWHDIDAIAVTQGPGLSGSLLIGSLAARTLAVTKNKPLYGVHHVTAHAYANFITEQGPNTDFILPGASPEFPILALIVSGGHSQLVLFESHFNYKLLGQTLDDAVGEAFDKVAKIIGLPYPGGPSISKLAPKGDPEAISLPISRLDNPYDFSFSGLKTATLRAAQAAVGGDYQTPSYEISSKLTDTQRANFAASFQAIAARTLVQATERAAQEHQPASVVIAGGVAANQLLRTELRNTLSDYDISYAPPQLCTDNAAMIAALAYFQSQKNEAQSPLGFEIQPSWSM